MLVEFLARAVAAGLARQEEERKALTARIQFEQFFTADLVRELSGDPHMLEGKQREVSVLFCDIRRVTRVSQMLGPAATIEWLRDVLDHLSECVLEEGGVLVDYIGDELMAMWGAPVEQPDHAARACRAALTILQRLPGLNKRWQDRLGEETGLGIGINTGAALVGNVGSRHKFKYGALGSTVNLASRVEGATRYFRTRVLITGETARHLDSSFQVRRLGRVHVVNIQEPVDLFELFSPGWSYAAQARQEYEHALELFEKNEFDLAVRILANWRGQCPTDDPVLVLLQRAVTAMVEGAPSGHPVWPLPGR
jgi:adenylate cyclase